MVLVYGQKQHLFREEQVKIGYLFGQQLSESQGKLFVISCTVLH